MKVRRRVRPGAFKPWLRKLALPAVVTLTFALVLAAAAGGVTADATAPTLTLTSPVAGTVSGSVPLAANATDASGTPAILFKVDGKPAGTPWDTTAVANGSHYAFRQPPSRRQRSADLSNPRVRSPDPGS